MRSVRAAEKGTKRAMAVTDTTTGIAFDGVTGDSINRGRRPPAPWLRTPSVERALHRPDLRL